MQTDRPLRSGCKASPSGGSSLANSPMVVPATIPRSCTSPEVSGAHTLDAHNCQPYIIAANTCIFAADAPSNCAVVLIYPRQSLPSERTNHRSHRSAPSSHRPTATIGGKEVHGIRKLTQDDIHRQPPDEPYTLQFLEGKHMYTVHNVESPSKATHACHFPIQSQKRKATRGQYVHRLSIEPVKGCNLEAFIMPDIHACCIFQSPVKIYTSMRLSSQTLDTFPSPENTSKKL